MLKTTGNTPVRSGDQTINSGNLVIGTAGNGIDFTANTHSAGMTSELFNWYEEGTWTPTIAQGATAITYASQGGWYTRIGRQVFISGVLSTSAATGDANQLRIGGLPFTSSGTIRGGSYITYDNGTLVGSTSTNLPTMLIALNGTQIRFLKTDGANFNGTDCVAIGSLNFFFVGQYTV